MDTVLDFEEVRDDPTGRKTYKVLANGVYVGMVRKTTRLTGTHDRYGRRKLIRTNSREVTAWQIVSSFGTYDTRKSAAMALVREHEGKGLTYEA